jgi:NhaP-type Na+/H+ or K+/H+ antiporter
MSWLELLGSLPWPAALAFGAWLVARDRLASSRFRKRAAEIEDGLEELQARLNRAETKLAFRK